MENIKFAWRPTRVTSGKCIWLESYIQHRSLYDESTGRPPINSFYFEWTETLQERTFRVLKESVQHNRNVWNTTELTKQDKI